MKKVSFKNKLILMPFFIWPRGLKKFLSFFITFLWVYVLRLRVEETKTRIKRILPEKTSKEVSRIVFSSFYNLILLLFEYSYFAWAPKKVLKYTELLDFHYFTDEFKKNKPVFLTTTHSGNGEMILFRMGLEGYPFNLIGKRVGTPWIDNLLFEIREASGLKHIPPKRGGVGIIKAAQNREPVVFIQDQFMHPPKGLKTSFLGVETYTNPALANFTKKCDATVVPVEIYRENGIIKAQFHKALPFEEKSDTDEKNTLYMTQFYNGVLESFITRRPDQWMWIHRRWKKIKPKKA